MAGFRSWRRGQWRWDVAVPFAGAADLARRLGTAPLVAQILHNRGVADEAAGKAFLNPRLTDLHDPAMLAGAEAAAQRIVAAVRNKEPITIYGDYDVDGMTATAILHACIVMIGGRADYYVPHRLEEGYGVNVEAMRKIIAGGAKLVITVDCGISAIEPLAEAAAAGVDVIVTDHHIPGPQLPHACAIVHPALGTPAYPNRDLSGAGVAFKVAWQVARAHCGAVRVNESLKEFLLNATCLAALGTIADVVPLVGENRALATFGLRGLPASKQAGLRALIESAALTGQSLGAYDVGFKLAPRLNACGRMGHARDAVEMLTGEDEARCRAIAKDLSQKNTERQTVERQIAAEAVEMVRSRGLDGAGNRVIVLASPAWHGGVIGIVASRLVDQFHRPAVLISLNGSGGQGSARSIPGFHMADALTACGGHLISFGGHAMAGGLRIEEAKVPAFVEAMSAYAATAVTDGQMASSLAIDAEVSLASLNYMAVDHLARLAPFGQGNPAPLVVARGCKVLVPPKRMGKTGQTVGLMLAQGDVRMRAVGFNMGDLCDEMAAVNTIDVAARPSLNTFNGNTSIELQLEDVSW
ncbi:MAG: single-stranded-DNA-specific exonuclease RecJ [Planctomycetaceae bacterium]|nr:single-stranded-DNA-specific exonuclease RecJ [Planctomycetaceae bacterium]